MKRIFTLRLISFFIGSMLILSSCLKSGLDDLENSPDKELTSVDYTYRFLYNDTIKKGTPNEEILEGRVCEVLFKKQSLAITDNGMQGYETTLTYDINSVLKAGPTGSVTKEMLYTEFQKLISNDNLTKLWVYTTISDAASITPQNGAPQLGAPGDFSVDRVYRVKAADGSTQDYVIKTIKGF